MDHFTGPLLRELNLRVPPQFSLKTMLWAMAPVAAFFAGAKWQERRTSCFTPVVRSYGTSLGQALSGR